MKTSKFCRVAPVKSCLRGVWKRTTSTSRSEASNHPRISELWHHPGTKSLHRTPIHSLGFAILETWKKGDLAVSMWQTSSHTFRYIILSWLLYIQDLHPGVEAFSERPYLFGIRLNSFSLESSDVIKQLVRNLLCVPIDIMVTSGSLMTCLRLITGYTL